MSSSFEPSIFITYVTNITNFWSFFLRLRKLLKKRKNVSNKVSTKYNLLPDDIKINGAFLLHKKVYICIVPINCLNLYHAFNAIINSSTEKLIIINM